MKHSINKILVVFFLIVIFLSTGGYLALRNWIILEEPIVEASVYDTMAIRTLGDSLHFLGNNWLHQNDKGLWEQYTEGAAYERGLAAGRLSKGLIDFQEEVFIERIDQLVPSRSYQRFLRLLIAFFNQPIYKHIPQEYLLEIYGISRSANDAYDFVGPGFDRMVHYHGAHDIGHMLQNYSLVGCTSFGVWGEKSADSSLLIGRNFDFYVGDDFDKEKIVEFCRPDSGYSFMMLTWGGMRGVVSGMNEKGLTVTVNAAKSVIPLSVADPVSLISREILQYASTIDEALQIAQSRQCFVSESYLIGSAIDGKAIVIEKSPHAVAVFEGANNQIICTNHFQSQKFMANAVNLEHIQRSASMPRYNRVQELLSGQPTVDVLGIAAILRDQGGLGNSDIGMGNEKAINQLIAHHSIIFQPESLLVWVSAGPYILNEFICYDLKAILSQPKPPMQGVQIYKKELNLPPDSFYFSQKWNNYVEFKLLTTEIINKAENNALLTIDYLNRYTQLNPLFFYGYEVCGDYLMKKQQVGSAIAYYRKALELDIPTTEERERIENKLNKLSADD